MKANGVVLPVLNVVLPLPGSHFPKIHIFFSQNLNQQIQFTSHASKVVLELRVLPFGLALAAWVIHAYTLYSVTPLPQRQKNKCTETSTDTQTKTLTHSYSSVLQKDQERRSNERTSLLHFKHDLPHGPH